MMEMPTLADIIESPGKSLKEREAWCILQGATKFLNSDSRGNLVISPECLLISKGQIKFVSGVQSLTGRDYIAPEHIQDDGSSSNKRNDVKMAETYSLGVVLSKAIGKETSTYYSDQLQSTIEKMTALDPKARMTASRAFEISNAWLDNHPSDLSVEQELEKLVSNISGVVESIDSDLPTDHNLAEEIEAADKANRYVSKESLGSSNSLSSRSSYYEDAMSRSDSHHSNVSDVLLKKRWMSHSSSNEHLKDGGRAKLNKKSLFYTPVRSRKTSKDEDKAPRPPSGKKPVTTRIKSDTEFPSTPPLSASLTMEDFPPLPPHPAVSKQPVDTESTEILAMIVKEDPAGSSPQSVKRIEHILESSSAPDLLEVETERECGITPSKQLAPDLFKLPISDSQDEINVKNFPPTPPPPSTLPPDSPPSSTPFPNSHQNDVHHSTQENLVMETSLTTTPPEPSETTFDYADMSSVKQGMNESTDEFQLTPPPIPVNSPPRSDNEMDTSSHVPLSDEFKDSHQNVSKPEDEEPGYATVLPAVIKKEIQHDEFGYAIVEHRSKRLSNEESSEDESSDKLPKKDVLKDDQGQLLSTKSSVKKRLGVPNNDEEEFEHTQTLDRFKNKLIREEMIKASSEDKFLPPLLNSPERKSMPADADGYEMIDFILPRGRVSEAETETTTFQPKAQDTPSTEKIRDDKENVVHFRIPESTYTRKSKFKYSHSVVVHCPGRGQLELGVKPTTPCNELLERVLASLEIEERDTFGLAVIKDNGGNFVKSDAVGNNEVMFMEPARMIQEYADKKWKKKKKSTQFHINLRVMYFFKNPSFLRKQQTRDIHYEQVKRDMVSGRISASDETHMLLAALALQADGKEPSDNREYYKPEKYLPKEVLNVSGGMNVYEQVAQKHSRLQAVVMSRERAQYCYLEEAMSLEDCASTFYSVLSDKKEPMLLGFNPSGILVFNQAQARKEIHSRCGWKAITNICSNNKKLILSVDGQDKLTFHTDNYERAAYFVRLSRLYHQFDRKMRGLNPLHTLKGLDTDERKRILEGTNEICIDEYSGEFITRKLQKDETHGLGFIIKNHISPAKKKYVEVEGISKGTPAYNLNFPRLGDFIVEINGINVIGREHSVVGKHLKQCAPLVEMTTFRRKYVGENVTQGSSLHSHVTPSKMKFDYEGEFIDVRLLRDEICRFGFSLSNHITPNKNNYVEVIGVQEGGPAYSQGCPKKGDLIVKVNGEFVMGLTHAQVGEKLKETVSVAQIQVLRRKTNTVGPGIEEQDSFKTVSVEVTENEELSRTQNIDKQSASRGPSPPQAPSAESVTSQDPSVDDSSTQNLSLENSKPPPVRSLNKMGKSSVTTLDRESSIVAENGPALPMSPVKLKTVILKKDNSSFGFAISGSSKNPYRSVYISKITSGGAADKSGSISVGDHIISVNGQSIEGRGYKEIFAMLRSTETKLHMQLCSPEDDNSKVSIELDKSKGKLGLCIEQADDGRIVVADVIGGSQAAETGLIHKGDEILQVNGTSFYGLGIRDAMDVILNSPSQTYILLNSSIRQKQSKFNFMKENPIPEVNEQEQEDFSRDKAFTLGSSSPKSSPHASPLQDKRPSLNPSPPQEHRPGLKSSLSQDKRPSPRTSPIQGKKTSPKMSSSNDNRPSPSQDKRPSPRTSPIQGKKTSPKLSSSNDNRPSPSQDKRPSPRTSPTQGTKTSPKLSSSNDNRPSPSQDKRPSPRTSPIQGKKTSPKLSSSQDNRPSPSQDKRPSPRTSPIQGKKTSPKLSSSNDNRPSPSQDKRPSPRTSPIQGKKTSPKLSSSKDNRPSPSQDKRPSPRTSPIQGKKTSPKLSSSNDNRPSPSQDKRPSPGTSPIQGKKPSPKLISSKDKRSSPPQEKRPSPTPGLPTQERVSRDYHEVTISLTKGNKKGFGFKIRRDLPANRDGKGLFVASIDYDPALSDGRLQVGDEITQINGTSLVGLPYGEGVNTIRGIKYEGVFTVQRMKESHPQEEDDQDIPKEYTEEEYPALNQLVSKNAQYATQDNGEHEPDGGEATGHVIGETPTLGTIDEVGNEEQESGELPDEQATEDVNMDVPPPLPSSAPPPDSRPSSILVDEGMLIDASSPT